MGAIMKWLSEVFAPKMSKLFGRPWISGVAAAMQASIPFILAGSVISVYNVIKSYVPVLPDLSPLYNFTFGIISLIIAYEVASHVIEKLGENFYVVNSGIAAICAMLLVSKPVVDDGTGLTVILTNIGPSGIAVGMIIGLYTALVFRLWGKLHFLQDSSVPDFVTGWINTITPVLITLGLLTALIYGAGVDLFAAVTSVFMPISSIAQTLPGFVLIAFVYAFVFSLGVSSWGLDAVTAPIFTAAITANIAAVEAGGVAPYIVTSESVFTLAFITMGGVGATLALNILMCFSKSKKIKTLGRIFILPSFFNINEPVVYGTIVFNPLLMPVMWLNAIVGSVYVWTLMSTGLLNIPSFLLRVGQIPAPISSVLITNDLRAILWWALLLVIYLLIAFPFFKAWEKTQLEEEAKAGIETATEA